MRHKSFNTQDRALMTEQQNYLAQVYLGEPMSLLKLLA